MSNPLIPQLYFLNIVSTWFWISWKYLTMQLRQTVIQGICGPVFLFSFLQNLCKISFGFVEQNHPLSYFLTVTLTIKPSGARNTMPLLLQIWNWKTSVSEEVFCFYVFPAISYVVNFTVLDCTVVLLLRGTLRKLSEKVLIYLPNK